MQLRQDKIRYCKISNKINGLGSYIDMVEVPSSNLGSPTKNFKKPHHLNQVMRLFCLCII